MGYYIGNSQSITYKGKINLGHGTIDTINAQMRPKLGFIRRMANKWQLLGCTYNRLTTLHQSLLQHILSTTIPRGARYSVMHTSNKLIIACNRVLSSMWVKRGLLATLCPSSLLVYKINRLKLFTYG